MPNSHILTLACDDRPGILAEIIGLRATSWLAPIGGLVAAFILWASPVRTLISLPPMPGGTPAALPSPGADTRACAPACSP